mmetsp:Transcript_55881/g.103447  ORF Transcript_55881/g.103447 Transcript_55881/m.103447 type:complete len:252 (+) Transcript_55881:94-849(+)
MQDTNVSLCSKLLHSKLSEASFTKVMVTERSVNGNLIPVTPAPPSMETMLDSKIYRCCSFHSMPRESSSRLTVTWHSGTIPLGVTTGKVTPFIISISHFFMMPLAWNFLKEESSGSSAPRELFEALEAVREDSAGAARELSRDSIGVRDSEAASSSPLGKPATVEPDGISPPAPCHRPTACGVKSGVISAAFTTGIGGLRSSCVGLFNWPAVQQVAQPLTLMCSSTCCCVPTPVQQACCPMLAYARMCFHI